MIDWSLAVSTAQHMLPNGPPIEADDAQALINSLYAAAAEAEKHIGHITQLNPIAPLAKIAVVDRRKWAQSNVEGFRAAITPLVDSLLEKRGSESAGPRATTGLVGAIGSRATGFQVGTLLAYIGT